MAGARSRALTTPKNQRPRERTEKQREASSRNRSAGRVKAAAAKMLQPIFAGQNGRAVTDVSLTPGNLAAMGASTAFAYKGMPALQRMAGNMMAKAPAVGASSSAVPSMLGKLGSFAVKRALPIALAYGVTKGLYTGYQRGGVTGSIRGALMGAADAVDPSSWVGHGVAARAIGGAWDTTANVLSGRKSVGDVVESGKRAVGHLFGAGGESVDHRPNSFQAANQRYEAMRQARAATPGQRAAAFTAAAHGSKGPRHVWDDKARAAAAAVRSGKSANAD